MDQAPGKHLLSFKSFGEVSQSLNTFDFTQAQVPTTLGPTVILHAKAMYFSEQKLNGVVQLVQLVQSSICKLYPVYGLGHFETHIESVEYWVVLASMVQAQLSPKTGSNLWCKATCLLHYRPLWELDWGILCCLVGYLSLKRIWSRTWMRALFCYSELFLVEKNFQIILICLLLSSVPVNMLHHQISPCTFLP